jgi:hypothetical protein
MPRSATAMLLAARTQERQIENTETTNGGAA